MRGTLAKKIHAFMRGAPAPYNKWRVARKIWREMVLSKNGATTPTPIEAPRKRKPCAAVRREKQPHYGAIIVRRQMHVVVSGNTSRANAGRGKKWQRKQALQIESIKLNILRLQARAGLAKRAPPRFTRHSLPALSPATVA